MTNGHFESCVMPRNCWCETKIYASVFGLGLVVLIVQIGGGILSGSLALLADSGHVAVDEVALALTLLTAYLVKKYKPHERAIRATGGYVNAFLLFGIGIWVLIEAIERWQNPPNIEGLVLIGFAAIGGGGNWLQHELIKLAKHTEHTVTAKSAKLHILSDFWQSVGVVLGGIVIYFTGWFKVDVILSSIIALFMLYWAITIFLWSKGESGVSGHYGRHVHRH